MMMARIELNAIPESYLEDEEMRRFAYQCSMQNVNTENVCVVTGPETYLFLKLSEDFQSFEKFHTQLLPPDGELSTNYTCHTWTKEHTPRLVVATDEGDILLCNSTGEFFTRIESSPYKQMIDCVISYSHGLIFGGENGTIWPYEVTTNEGEYFRLQQEPLVSSDRVDVKDTHFDGSNIVSMVLSPSEDMLFYIDAQNQLLKVPIQLDNTEIETTQSSYVHSAFHMREITGMDICLRKQLIVTCSERSINIWNYHEKKLELSKLTQPGEAALAVAFHPSGFHILVAVADKIQMMNVLSNSIKEY